MKTTENITVTNGRLKKALTTRIEPIIMPKVSKQIVKAVNDSKLQIGILTKFYPYLDKVEVLVNDEKILCRILHRFGGDIIDFYTPIGEDEYCDELHEPCIVPRGELEVAILDVNNNTNEQILLGYLLDDELIGRNPASKGNLKLSHINGVNEYWIKFGAEGLDIRSPTTPVTNVGLEDNEMTEINYTNSNDTYTKAEVDQLLLDLKNEILGEDDN